MPGRYNINGGILTGSEIQNQIKANHIFMTPFDESNINPNSYNVRIDNIIQMYDGIRVIDLHDSMTYKNVREYEIPVEGMILRPGNLYLIRSFEVFGSDHYVPIITGRSSMGRLGIQMHQEAGFGDIGYVGKWTFQVRVTYPTKIYPGLKMAQVYFMKPVGNYEKLYNGHYMKSQMASQYNILNE